MAAESECWFGTEEACGEYLFCSRWPDGFVCPGRGGRDAGEQTRRHLWICTGCGRQTSITAGTVCTRLGCRCGRGSGGGFGLDVSSRDQEVVP